MSHHPPWVFAWDSLIDALYCLFEGETAKNRCTQRFWGPGWTWQDVSRFSRSISEWNGWKIGCSCPFTNLQLQPSMNLILLIPPVPTSGFSFNDMFGSFTLYLFGFMLSLSLLDCLLGLSVILHWKVIRGQHTQGALLRFVIFLSRTPSFCLSFCVCGRRPYREISPLRPFVLK